MLVRQIAMKLSVKRGERYSDTVGFVRRRIRFDLLRTCVIALRGYKKTTATDSIRDLDFNLRPVAYFNRQLDIKIRLINHIIFKHLKRCLKMMHD